MNPQPRLRTRLMSIRAPFRAPAITPFAGGAPQPPRRHAEARPGHADAGRASPPPASANRGPEPWPADRSWPQCITGWRRKERPCAARREPSTEALTTDRYASNEEIGTPDARRSTGQHTIRERCCGPPASRSLPTVTASHVQAPTAVQRRRAVTARRSHERSSASGAGFRLLVPQESSHVYDERLHAGGRLPRRPSVPLGVRVCRAVGKGR